MQLILYPPFYTIGDSDNEETRGFDERDLEMKKVKQILFLLLLSTIIIGKDCGFTSMMKLTLVQNTGQPRYLEFKGNGENTSRYPLFEIRK